MEFRHFFSLMQKRWWIIVIIMIVALNLSLVNSYYLTEPRYEASALFIVSPNINQLDSDKDFVDSLNALDKRSIIATYAEVINSQQVFNAALENLNADPKNFRDYKTEAVVLPEATSLRFTVQGPDPEIAALLANSVGQYSIDFINELYQVYTVSFITQASPPNAPYQPRVLQEGLLSLVIGAALGVGFVVLQDQLSGSLVEINRLRSTDKESLAHTRISFERLLRDEITQGLDNDMTFGLLHLHGLEGVYNSLPPLYINQILRKVTATFQNYLRGHDVIGRWSQLTFGILLPTTGAWIAKDVLGRIRQMLEQPISLPGQEDVTISLEPFLGITELMHEGQTLSSLVETAEQALEVALQSEEKMYSIPRKAPPFE